MTIPSITMLAEAPLTTYTDRVKVTCPEDAAEVMLPLMANLDREHAYVVSLDTKHRILGVDTLSIGSVDHTFMSPREVYRTALMRGAATIYVAHNHPSGDPAPSVDDRTVTRRLAQAGAMLCIDMLDHIVIGDSSWTSLARLGVL